MTTIGQRESVRVLESLSASERAELEILDRGDRSHYKPFDLEAEEARVEVRRRQAMDNEAILSWFTGKAQKEAEAALAVLDEAESADSAWPKGASRRVRAALNKQAVAKKFARAEDAYFVERDPKDHRPRSELLSEARFDDGDGLGEGSPIVHAMSFGLFERAPHCLRLCNVLAEADLPAPTREALATARRWCEAFAPVARIVEVLDRRRPVRTVVWKTLSPTVAAHFAGHLHLRLDSVRSPEMEWIWRDGVDKDGKPTQYLVARIKWPPGTVHDSSRFSSGKSERARHEQCHACGHAIKNPFNWVPVLIDDASGVPHSFWIGRDCAQSVFGAEVEGDAQYEEVA